METEIISRVEISDSDELLLYRQSGGRPAYQHVYRAAAGVYWDQGRGAFKFATKKQGEYADWFAHMLNVVKAEMGLILLPSEHTLWVSVPEAMGISCWNSKSRTIPSSAR
jgi:hypothetical protein